MSVPSTKKQQRMKKRQQRKSAAISKAANNTTTAQRASKRQVSTAAIEAIRYVTEVLKPFELSRTQRLYTYQSMMQDEAVFTAVNDRIMAIQTAQMNGKFRFNPNSENSVAMKDFLQYNLDNLEGQTPRSIGACAAEMVINGFAPFENVTYRDDKEYEGQFVLKKLAYIHPLSLDTSNPYTVIEGGDQIKELRQLATAFRGTDGTYMGSKRPWTGIREIDYRKVTVASYSATTSQPFGKSPLDAAYTAWREKQLLQDYMMIGVTRDFSGTPVLRLPSEILEAAESDPTSPEAQQVTALARGMKEMHTGDASFIILPSDSQSENGSGLRDYDIQFLGVEGGGKGFDINAIIESKRKGIFGVLAGMHLISGENGGSSYNLREGQASTQAMHVQLDSEIIDEMYNKHVFPKLLDLNGWEYKLEDLPRWESGEVQPLSVDEFGKAINRVKPFLPATSQVVNQVMKGIGLKDCDIDENLSPEEVRKLMITYVEPNLPDVSKDTNPEAGDGEGSSGTGSTQDGGLGSDTNSENAS
ncbi:portal protein [Vibrio phage 1.121.O._10N.286.46.C4]|nr:portal protein [Vibrio phage 1.121.O._10N.286.46.C4]